ncbi:DUF397 domain-containing protein [Streptomyces gamaensis]|uniref:DUF397 domain-containing protein n=1 Tax=Streptomyces gamaensis TaxID=1763542 RepID=A0ABW0Z893_9ACTN
MFAPTGVVPVRDSKRPGGPALAVSAPAWTAFVRSSSIVWEKSSYSEGNGGQCLEWAPALAPSGFVPVRDGKHPDRAPLAAPTAAWASFVAPVRCAKSVV